MQPPADYEDQMLLVVSDSFALSSQTTTTAELLEKTKDWSRLLFQTIPASELRKCFDYARAHHDSPFAISGYEIEQAYRKLNSQPKLRTLEDIEFEKQQFFKNRQRGEVKL